MITRWWRLPALWLTLCLALVWGLAGCAQGSAISPAVPTPEVSVGVHVQCPTSQDCGYMSSAWSQTMTALLARARHGLDVPNAYVELLDHGDAIQISLPGVSNQQLAVSVLTTQGVVQFIEVGRPLTVGTRVAANQYPVLFTGAQIDPGSVSAMQSESNLPIMNFEFQGAARAAFAAYTRTHVGGYLTITRDNVVIESSPIQREIDGQCTITIFTSISDAWALTAELKSPPLPYPVTIVSVTTFDPSRAVAEGAA